LPPRKHIQRYDSVVIGDLDPLNPFIRPDEARTELIIDPYAVLPPSIPP
jgi:hypothetical protein